ncbi:MAG: rhodanese-like domain-containing protein [Rhodospirillales bacterium]|nr:rhodanese-like domain-containing protein [Rhodospirillales bacterium]
MTGTIQDMAPAAVAQALDKREIVLIDVREPAEYAAEHIHGALLFPLSDFDPACLPASGRRIVLHCGSGKRSAMAVQRCLEAGVAVDTHMPGGIQAWKHLHLPVRRFDPATGSVVERR